jgi:hypothetical protein
MGLRGLGEWAGDAGIVVIAEQACQRCDIRETRLGSKRNHVTGQQLHTTHTLVPSIATDYLQSVRKELVHPRDLGGHRKIDRAVADLDHETTLDLWVDLERSSLA